MNLNYIPFSINQLYNNKRFIGRVRRSTTDYCNQNFLNTRQNINTAKFNHEYWDGKIRLLIKSACNKSKIEFYPLCEFSPFVFYLDYDTMTPREISLFDSSRNSSFLRSCNVESIIDSIQSFFFSFLLLILISREEGKVKEVTRISTAIQHSFEFLYLLKYLSI